LGLISTQFTSSRMELEWRVRQLTNECDISLELYCIIKSLWVLLLCIANYSRSKTFTVRHQSCIAKAHCTGNFTGNVSRLPINPQKLQNFSTVNDLQHTNIWDFMVILCVHMYVYRFIFGSVTKSSSIPYYIVPHQNTRNA